MTGWIGSLPFLVTAGGWIEGARNVALLGLVSGIYYWRAKTEETPLLADPAYGAYWNWAQENALVPRFLAKLTGRKRPLVRLARSEEHTSELQSLMRNSHAIFCLNTKQP